MLNLSLGFSFLQSVLRLATVNWKPSCTLENLHPIIIITTEGDSDSHGASDRLTVTRSRARFPTNGSLRLGLGLQLDI